MNVVVMNDAYLSGGEFDVNEIVKKTIQLLKQEGEFTLKTFLFKPVLGLTLWYWFDQWHS